MKDVLKNVVSLGLGALYVTKDKVEAVVGELVKKGEFGKEDAKQLIDELIAKGEKNRKDIEKYIEDTIKNIIEKLDIPTRKELNEIKIQLEELKKKVTDES